MVDISTFKRIRDYNREVYEDRVILERKAEEAFLDGDMDEVEWILKKIDDLKYQKYADDSGPELPAWLYGMRGMTKEERRRGRT